MKSVFTIHGAKSGVAFYSTNVAFDLNFGHAPEMSKQDYEGGKWEGHLPEREKEGVTTLLTFSRCKETVYCATEECVNVCRWQRQRQRQRLRCRRRNTPSLTTNCKEARRIFHYLVERGEG